MAKWMDIALSYRGTAEIAGKQHNPKILKFFAEAGHAGVKDDETAWCAAFANAVLKQAGIKGTGALNARSFLTWGKKLDRPQYGCITVFRRGNSSWQGHVAFFVAEDKDTIHVLGGNQSNTVNVSRYPRSALLGYRWPAASPVAVATKTAVGTAVIGAGGVAAADAGVPIGWIAAAIVGALIAGTALLIIKKRGKG